MANMFLDAVNRIKNLTPGNKGAPAATGNTSDTTIAAASAESKPSTPSTPASQNTRPTPGKNNYGRKDDKRDESAGAQALTQNINPSTTKTPSYTSSTNWRNTEAGEAISLGTATDAQKIEALEQGATAQNVGFTNVDALPDGKYINNSGKLDDTANLLKNATVEQTQTAADGSTITYQTSFDTLSEEQKAQYDTEAYADAVSRENIEKQTPKYEIRTTTPESSRIAFQIETARGTTSTPGLREAAIEEQKVANRENLVIGNFYTAGETLFTNPNGSINLQDNIFEQLDDWDAYDGSGDYRKAKSIAAAVELPTYFIGGGLAGGGAKAAQIGINKLGATTAGKKIVDVATSPIVKADSVVSPILAKTETIGKKLDTTLEIVNGVDTKVDKAVGFTSELLPFDNLVYSVADASRPLNIAANSVKTANLLTVNIPALDLATSAGKNLLIDALKYGYDAGSPVAVKASELLLNPLVKEWQVVEASSKIVRSPIIATKTSLEVSRKGVYAVDAFTRKKLPVIMNAVTTPTALAVNAGTVAYGVDVGSRIAAQPTTEKRLEQAAAIALKEIPFGAAGAIKGFTATEKIADKLSTIGKTEIPYKEIVAPGIPLGDYKPAQLQKSFEQNRLIPEPYKIARSENPRNYRGSVSLNPDRTDFIEAFHATGSGQYFGKRVTVAEGSSEVSGLWTAPKAVEHFLGDLDNTSPRFAILAREFGRTPQSKILDIRADPKIKFLDWDKAAREAGYSRGQVMRDPELRKEVGDAYIEKYTEFGEAISPSLKNEYEAVFKPGTELKRLRRKYYTRAPSGKVIPIDEYKVTNKSNALSRPEAKQEKAIKTTDKDYDTATFKALSSYSKSRTNRPQLPAFSAYRPARVEAVKIPSYTKMSGNSSIKTQLPATLSSPLSPSATRVVSPLSPRLSSVPSSVKKSQSSTISNKTGKSSASPYSYSGYKPGFAYPGDVRKKKEPRAKEPEYYTAARVGRIDRLSIVDPAEMIGRGSLTDRSRPDRVFNREVLYITDGQIGTKKPKGRIRK